MIAESIRDGRMAKGYTQKELAELSNISIRSIQRIENGEIVPRSFTLRTLAAALEISILEQAPAIPKARLNRNQKIILSAGVSLFLLLACLAFIMQSPTFPETFFEGLCLFTGVTLVLTGMLTWIWRSRS